jgi:hypothetical protein
MVREARIAARASAPPARLLFALLAGLLSALDAFGAAPLPYQSSGKHLGVATCASSVCHGSVVPVTGHDVRLDEFVTWSHEDRHAQAYATLTSEKGRAIGARLGIADTRQDKRCLDCHSDNVPPARRGPGFTLTDGVSCEACHGGAAPWLTSHAARGAIHRENVARGMYPTAGLRERASLCLSCHMGNEDKFATHRIMGAGHPRLAFELDTFLALEPPHYRVDDDYAKRKPAYTRAQVWVHGQLSAAQSQLQLLQGPMVRNSGFLPELALLDCHSCHENPLHQSDWSRGALTRLAPPGSVPFADGHLKMAIIIARRMDPRLADSMVSQAQRLQKSSAEERDQILAASSQLSQSIGRTIELADARTWNHEDSARMLNEIVELGASGECRTYISAEQAVMAAELLMIDLGIAAQHRKELDELYRTVRNDDAYRPGQLREQMTSLSASLRATNE